MSKRTKWVFADSSKEAEWGPVLKEMFKAVKTGPCSDLLFYVKFKKGTRNRKVYAGYWGGKKHWVHVKRATETPQTGVYYARPVFTGVSRFPQYVKQLFWKHPGHHHIIVLKIHERNGFESDIAWLIAHEYKHYLQRLNGQRLNEKYVIEAEANKYAEKRVKALSERGYIHKGEWVGPDSIFAKAAKAGAEAARQDTLKYGGVPA